VACQIKHLNPNRIVKSRLNSQSTSETVAPGTKRAERLDAEGALEVSQEKGETMKRHDIYWILCLELALSGCRTKEPALGEPLAGLTPDQQAQFAAGKRVFQRVFTPEDGLGPLFNANSCAECHEKPATGGVGDEIEVQATRFSATNMCDALFPQGGPVIQQHATPLLQAKGIQMQQTPPGAQLARRSTPPLFGLGLVDAIPDETVTAREGPNDPKPPGILGHANRSIDGRVGRFSRKAGVPTLLEFTARAFPNEMGITRPLSPVEGTVGGAPMPPDTDPAPDPEIGMDDIQKALTFVRFLAPPPPLHLTNFNDRVLAGRGRRVFQELDCAACHVPEMRTGRNPIQALDRKRIALYSDLLVHDMGADLSDICMGQAQASEFRTELLMGLRFRDQFLHDGSAQSVSEAIERHGGEAQSSRDRFKALTDYDKSALLIFLGTL
jgi:CxxC motif-containing protein (DUF1111 family)